MYSPYASEVVYDVGGSEVIVRELVAAPEYHVWLDGEKYEVWFDEDQGWFTEIDGVEEGPWETADDVLQEIFLNPEG